MAKDGVMPKRVTGAHWAGKGKCFGNTLKFVSIPVSVSDKLLEELLGLDVADPHPLKGAVFYTENHTSKTFDIVVSQNDLEDLYHAFMNWPMALTFMEYADDETRTKIEIAKEVATF